jgi:flagellar biosynthesis protein
MDQKNINQFNIGKISPGENLKPRTAVALSYEPNEDAPKVLASGKGYLADKIIQGAKDAEIPLHQDERLAESLSKLEIGAMIPPELYEVVAEVLVFVDKMDRIKGKVYKDEQ